MKDVYYSHYRFSIFLGQHKKHRTQTTCFNKTNMKSRFDTKTGKKKNKNTKANVELIQQQQLP